MAIPKDTRDHIRVYKNACKYSPICPKEAWNCPVLLLGSSYAETLYWRLGLVLRHGVRDTFWRFTALLATMPSILE